MAGISGKHLKMLRKLSLAKAKVKELEAGLPKELLTMPDEVLKYLTGTTATEEKTEEIMQLGGAQKKLALNHITDFLKASKKENGEVNRAVNTYVEDKMGVKIGKKQINELLSHDAFEKITNDTSPVVWYKLKKK